MSSALPIEKRGIVVAVDGPAGAGKTTVSRALAERLRLPHINTGLMYRALTARAIQAAVDPADWAGLERLARSISFSLSEDEVPELRIDGRHPGADLASKGVEIVVSVVSRHPQVRSVMRHEQRALGAGGSVMEGRDIGSVVFPDADVKIFLSGAPDVRAARRERERGDRTLREAVAARDALDAQTNAFEPVPGAHVIDTTRRTRKQVVAEALEVVRSALEEAR